MNNGPTDDASTRDEDADEDPESASQLMLRWLCAEFPWGLSHRRRKVMPTALCWKSTKDNGTFRCCCPASLRKRGHGIILSFQQQYLTTVTIYLTNPSSQQQSNLAFAREVSDIQELYLRVRFKPCNSIYSLSDTLNIFHGLFYFIKITPMGFWGFGVLGFTDLGI